MIAINKNISFFFFFFFFFFFSNELKLMHTELVRNVIRSSTRENRSSGWGFRPGLTQTDLYIHRSRLEAYSFGFKKRNSTIRVAKMKAQISFAVTAKLICAIVFA